MEARASDQLWNGAGTRIDPHHLTAARNKLFKDGVIRQAVATTRGRIVRSSRGISLQWTRSPPLPSQLESAYSPLDTMGGLEGAARDAG